MDNNDDNEIISEDYDAPIFIFPDENPSDSESSDYSSSSSNDQEEETVSGLFSSRLSGSSDSSDTDESSHFSFGRVNAVKKEKEFVYMPYLDDDKDDDDDDDDDGEASSLTFGRVHAAKKEKEFVYLPFLNVSDDGNDNDDEAEQKSYVIRPDGTVFDEGMILLPISPLDDDDDEDEDNDSSDDDDDMSYDDVGIYVTDASPDDFARRPAKRPSSQSSKRPPSKKGNGKKRPPSGAPRPGSSSKKGKGKSKGGSSTPTAEQQFRAAMMNINPEIRRAAMRDPIQRAALEQAVRIALVQQAAQEAVARTTGNPGGYGNNGFVPASAAQQGAKKGKKKRPQPTATAASAANNANVRGFSLSGFNSAPADFGSAAQPAAAAQTPAPAPAVKDYSNESFEYNPSGTPDAVQDPVLGSLNANSPVINRTAPSEQQDPVIASLSNSGSSGQKTMASYSPAAIRAAMRAGIDLSLPQTAAAAASATQSTSSAQKAKMLESVNARRSGCLIWIIVLFIVFFIGLLGIAVWPSLSTEMKYQEASSLMADGNYIEASETFRSLEDYKDSTVKANESIYVYALSLQNSGDYQKAIEYYSTISHYSTTSERIAECRYILGKQYMSEGNYEAAYDQLYLIPKYNDAGNLAKESNYQCALKLYNEGNYSLALVRFGMFPEYLDSTSYWQICQYENATALLDAGSNEDAYKQFTELGDYKDSAFNAALAQYYMMVNGNRSFTIDQIKASLQIIAATNNNTASEMIESTVYTEAKLDGAWYNDAGTSYVIYNAYTETPTMTICLGDENTPGSDMLISDVKFDNNIAYFMYGDNQTLLIRVESFTPDNAASPDSVVVFNYANNETYTLTRRR